MYVSTGRTRRSQRLLALEINRETRKPAQAGRTGLRVARIDRTRYFRTTSRRQTFSPCRDLPPTDR